MAYTDIDKPSDYFNTKLYTGNGGTQSITGVGFQPDLNWTKGRNVCTFHMLTDAVRGVTKAIQSNTSTAEQTFASGLTSFNSDGFTAGNSNDINGNYNYVSWNWKANGTGSANTDGTISSTVSANTTSGFSIVSWTGNGSAGATVGHGLGSTPKMIIVKRRNTAAQWNVYHESLGNTGALYLNDTRTFNVVAGFWNNTSPNSTTFTLGTDAAGNASGDTYIAYCFAEKKGFSKFGSYVGNGNADGTFVYTGFKPAWVMIKASSTAQSWQMSDNKRDTFNAVDHRLRPNESGAESTSPEWIDFCSNGFKLRNNDVAWNGSGQTYIFMAFAENPLVGTNNIPATAR